MVVEGRRGMAAVRRTNAENTNKWGVNRAFVRFAALASLGYAVQRSEQTTSDWPPLTQRRTGITTFVASPPVCHYRLCHYHLCGIPRYPLDVQQMLVLALDAGE